MLGKRLKLQAWKWAMIVPGSDRVPDICPTFAFFPPLSSQFRFVSFLRSKIMSDHSNINKAAIKEAVQLLCVIWAKRCPVEVLTLGVLWSSVFMSSFLFCWNGPHARTFHPQPLILFFPRFTRVPSQIHQTLLTGWTYLFQPDENHVVQEISSLA